MNCKKAHATESTPWTAIILHKDSGKVVCLGSIIDNKHILTARKCITNTEPTEFKILLGYYKAYWGRHSQVKMVDKVHKHPHGLVILELTKTITFSKTVKAIKLLVKGEKDKDVSLPATAKRKRHKWIRQFNNRTKYFRNNSFDSKEIFNNFNVNFTIKTVEQREEKEDPVDIVVPKGFEGIKEVQVVGFPVTYFQPIGEPMPKSFVYVMRDDEVEESTKCEKIFDIPLLQKDEHRLNRFYCLKGTSKFCWGCLGGPIVDKKTLKQVGVVGVAETTDNCEKEEKSMVAYRVDSFFKWIRDNSLYV